MIKEYMGTVKFALVFIIIGYLIVPSLGNGILLGFALGTIQYFIRCRLFGAMLSQQSFNPSIIMIYFIGNIGVFAAPFYIGCVHPDVVNVFGAAFGLALRNIYVYTTTLFFVIADYLHINLRKER